MSIRPSVVRTIGINGRRPGLLELLAVAAACCLLLAANSVYASPAPDPTRWTFSPFFEYRADPSIDYDSMHLLGPIVKSERKGLERDRALRPLFFLSTDQQRQAAQLDILYPLFTYKHDDAAVSYRLFFLINYYSNRDDEYSQRNFSLFPIIYYRNEPGEPLEHSIFPVSGHFYEKLGRDEIRYLLFPFYSRTYKDNTRVDNVLWPFFARISGADPMESGLKTWPLFGYSSYPGVYRKSMFLWPFWISEDLQQNTEVPVTVRYSFPFYLYSESPLASRRTAMWPFFSYVDDRKNGYTEWSFPWPLFQYARGEKYHGYKALPLISDMTRDDRRVRWFLWPVLKMQTQSIGSLEQGRTQVLFFLYSDLYEREEGSTADRRHRTLLWPLFGYRQEKGVSHFYTLSLLEPIFQQSEGVIRNWSPLWRIYQRKWDTKGNSVSSVLWNLFWHERSPDGVAWELFPAFSYRHESGVEREWSILKGLIRYRNKAQEKKLHLFYLPWGIPLGEDAT